MDDMQASCVYIYVYIGIWYLINDERYVEG